MKASALKSPIDYLVEDYQEHLINVAGLQPSTCQKWTFFVRLFLNAQFRPKAPEVPLHQLKPGVLLDFVLQQGEHYRPGHLQSLASALRSFCRFLCVSGRHPQDLGAALPSISGQHREDLPIYLSRTQLRALLEVFDRRTVLGKRDYAMVLCLAGLGLRAGEVSRLSLDDVDWRDGWLRLVAPQGSARAAVAAARPSGPGLGRLSAKCASPGSNPPAVSHRSQPTRDEPFLALPAGRRRPGARRLGSPWQTSTSVAPDFRHASGPTGSLSQGGGRLIGPRQSEHDLGLRQSQSADAAGGGPALARGGAAMKALSLKTAVAFYLKSRRRLGFALESEGALLENRSGTLDNSATADP